MRKRSSGATTGAGRRAQHDHTGINSRRADLKYNRMRTLGHVPPWCALAGGGQDAGAATHKLTVAQLRVAGSVNNFSCRIARLIIEVIFLSGNSW
jgi:hypothetical protein